MYNHRIKIPQNTTHLILGARFNQKIIQKIKIPQNITHLITDKFFKHKIKIPQNITHINFNTYKIKIPQNITHLKINITDRMGSNSLLRISEGIKKNKLIKIPQNVTHIMYVNYFCDNVPIKIKLSQNITHVYFIGTFNQKIFIPVNIKYFIIKSEFIYNNIIMPLNIKHLSINKNLLHKIHVPSDTIHVIPNTFNDFLQIIYK